MMNLKCLCLMVSICLAANLCHAQDKSTTKGRVEKRADIQKEVLRLEEAGRQKALKGESNWDDLTADGAYLIQGDGTIMIYQKGQNLTSIPLKSFEMSDMIARVYGESVVVTGLLAVDSETPDKRPFSFRMRFLNVWKRFNDGWKIVVAERTVIRPYSK